MCACKCSRRSSDFDCVALKSKEILKRAESVQESDLDQGTVERRESLKATGSNNFSSSVFTQQIFKYHFISILSLRRVAFGE